MLRVDDEWWRSHYPPSGWRCRCTVQQLSRDDLDRRGLAPTGRPEGATRQWVNRRTGEISRVPVGIDPGFERNAGSYAPAPAASKFLDGKIASAKPPIKDAAKPLLDDPVAYGAEGRTVRDSIGIDAAARPGKFLDEVEKRLRTELGAGTVPSGGVQTAGNASASALHSAEAVRNAIRLLPATWVKKAGPVVVDQIPKDKTKKASGLYYKYGSRIEIAPGQGLATAMHEYVHHLQVALPGFQDIFRKEHLRRTTNPDGTRHQPVASKYDGFMVRDDDYVDDYFGAVDVEDGIEVPTRGYEILFADLYGKEMLSTLAKDDPGMLDLLLGVLFRYEP